MSATVPFFPSSNSATHKLIVHLLHKLTFSTLAPLSGDHLFRYKSGFSWLQCEDSRLYDYPASSRDSRARKHPPEIPEAAERESRRNEQML